MADSTRTLKFLATINDKVSEPLKTICKNLKLFERSVNTVGNNIKNLGAMTMVPLGFAAAGVTAAVKNSVSAMVEYGGSVDDASRSLSIASDALQGFRYAAAQSGSSAEEMDGAIGMLNKNIANAAAGKNKALVDLMNRLGISMKGANGQMKSAAELMPEVADAIKNQTNGVQKAYIATQFFGRSGQNLIKLLNDGSEGLAAQRAEAEKFGVVMGADAVAAATRFGDSMTRNRYAIQGVQNAIGTKLLPILQPMLDGLNDWIAANREWFATEITGAVKSLADSLKDIDFKSVISGTVTLTKKAFDLFNALGGLKTVAATVAGLFAAKFVITLGATVSSIASLIGTFAGLGGAVLKIIPAVLSLNAALWSNPIVLIVGGIVAAIAAIGAAVYLIYRNWDSIVSFFKGVANKLTTVWDAYKAYLSNVWSAISNTAINAWNGLVSFITSIPSKLTSVWDAYKAYLSNVWSAISNTAINAWNGLVSFITSIPSKLTSVWDAYKAYMGTVFSGIFTVATTVFNALCNFLTDTVPNAIKAAWQALKDFMISIFNTIMEPINKITGAVGNITDKVSGVAGGAWNATKKFFGFGSDNSPAPAMAVAGEPPLSPASSMAFAKSQSTLTGQIDVNVHADKGTDAEVTNRRTSSQGVKVNTSNGVSR